MKRNRILVPTLLGAMVLAACGSREDPQDLAQMRQDSIAAAEAQRRAEEEARRRAEAEAEARRRAEAEAEARRRAEETARARAILAERVHFDFDRFNIRPDAEEVLLRKVAVLRANPAVRLRIEGHADERGSVEYNLALGMRRANAARDFLAAYGLDASRFEVVSYGEERPMARGSNEAAWAQNRRAEFNITSGGDNLTAPSVSQ